MSIDPDAPAEPRCPTRPPPTGDPIVVGVGRGRPTAATSGPARVHRDVRPGRPVRRHLHLLQRLVEDLARTFRSRDQHHQRARQPGGDRHPGHRHHHPADLRRVRLLGRSRRRSDPGAVRRLHGSKLGWPLWAGHPASRSAIGAFIGLTNGNTVARVGVNSLIVTLGVSSVLGGHRAVVHERRSRSVRTSRPTLINMGSGTWFGLPRTVYFLAVVALFVYYLLEHTPYGRYLHSIGSNRERRPPGRPPRRRARAAGVRAVGHAGRHRRRPARGPQRRRQPAVGHRHRHASRPWPPPTSAPPRSSPAGSTCVGTLVAIFFLAFTVTGLSLAGRRPTGSTTCSTAPRCSSRCSSPPSSVADAPASPEGVLLMATNAKADQLANVQLFATCTTGSWPRSPAGPTSASSAQGETVVKQGDPGSELYLILLGSGRGHARRQARRHARPGPVLRRAGPARRVTARRVGDRGHSPEPAGARPARVRGRHRRVARCRPQAAQPAGHPPPRRRRRELDSLGPAIIRRAAFGIRLSPRERLRAAPLTRPGGNPPGRLRHPGVAS